MKPFFTSSVNDYELVSNHINYMFEQYAQIHQFLKSNFQEPFHHLLAKPERVGTAIHWYSEISGEIKRVEDFPIEARTKLLNIYNARKHEIEATCIRLGNSDDFDKQLWSNILKSAFNPDNLFLFSNGEEVILVWGIKTNKQRDYHVPFDEYKSALLAPIFVEDEETEQPDSTEDEEASEEAANDAVEEEVYEEPLIEAEVPSTLSEQNVNDESEEFHVEETVQEQEQTPDVHHEKVAKKVRVVKPKHWFYSALDRFELFAGKYWWLILIILILLLWLMLDRCNRPAENVVLSDTEVEEIYDEIMPEIPRKRIIPIDSTDFREDDNTGNIVVAGLVNIALVENKETFKRMAVELKQQFPDDNYKIVYYDEETNRLQFNFPEEESAEMKEKIRTKLSKYNVLIWDESVFMTSKKSNDPFFKEEDKAWHMKAIHLEEAWDMTMGDTSVCIAVIDDGFDLKHKEFAGKRIRKPYNIVQDNTQVYSNSSIIHGTHVAGLALGSADNNSGASGVAPKCSFMPVQIGSGQEFFTMTDVVDGVLYALNHGADVINMSLGKSFSEALQGKSPSELDNIINTTGKDEEKFWKELFSMAEQKNTLIVLAGGNENLLIGLDPMQRSENVLKVVAVDQNLRKADFSNYCRNIGTKNMFISAPGVDIYSSIPGNQYKSLQGTSMAAPIVTGAIALMKSLRPEMKNKEILRILRQTSKTLPDRSCPPFLQLDQALKKVKNR
jgi:subtilisin family serine protease